MSDRVAAERAAKVDWMIADAIRAGTHCEIENWGGTVCPSCGEWRRPVWGYVVDKQGKRTSDEMLIHACSCTVIEFEEEKSG